MGALEVNELITRVETAVATVTGFNASSNSLNGPYADPASLQHLGFSVGATRTQDRGLGRHKPGGVAHVQTTIVVSYSHVCRAKQQTTDYKTAISFEKPVRQAILAMSRVDLDGMGYVQTSSRGYSPFNSGFLMIDMEFAFLHQIAL